MNNLKSEALEKVAHIHAQDAAWFFFFCLVVVGIGIIISMRDDKDD